MKKYDNFKRSLDVLKNADFEKADNDEIYQMGIIGQFNLTFELAWKTLQELLRLHGVSGTESSSPREILKKAMSVGFIDDSSEWIVMLDKRNTVVHVYDYEAVVELLMMIRDSFIPAFEELSGIISKKLAEVE